MVVKDVRCTALRLRGIAYTGATMPKWSAASVVGLLLFSAVPSVAQQDRPFLFSVTTPEVERPTIAVQYDTGFGERPFDVSTEAGRLEQRIGLQASFTNGFTVIAGVGVSPDQHDPRVSQRVELLKSVLGPARLGVSLAIGGGLRHESAGVDVLIGRVVFGRPIGASRLQGNVVVEKPLSSGRDAVDVITTAGWTRPITGAMWLGVEGIGEDLEGFWDPAEAEGGARLLVGPSVRVAPRTAKWQVAVTGGPMIHAGDSTATSLADRALPQQRARTGYAVRTSLSYAF